MMEFLTFVALLALGGAAVGGAFVFVVHVVTELLALYKVRLLSRMNCPGCKSAFGIAAATAARNAHMVQAINAHRANRGKGVLIDIEPFWDVDCPQCGKRTRFNYSRSQFV
jgi:hypothetical protein